MVGGEPALFIQRLRVTTLTLSSFAASPRVSKSKSQSIGRFLKDVAAQLLGS